MVKFFTRPMKAELIEDESKIEYPVIGSPKIDGIRCLKDDDKILSSTLKLIPNEHTRKILSELLPNGADGELTPRSGDGNFQKCTSNFMNVKGKPDFIFWMFDYVKDGNLSRPYKIRLGDMRRWYEGLSDWEREVIDAHVTILETKCLHNQQELENYKKRCFDNGFEEGIIVRAIRGPYKCGRSTLREGYCLKVKYRLDSEAKVIGFEEQMHNANKAEKDERGLTKRSSAKAGKVPANTLGKFLVRDTKTKVVFKIGTGKGLTAELRKKIWNNQKKYKGKYIKYSYQPAGVKEKPRQPSFLGFRHPRDMSK